MKLHIIRVVVFNYQIYYSYDLFSCNMMMVFVIVYILLGPIDDSTNQFGSVWCANRRLGVDKTTCVILCLYVCYYVLSICYIVYYYYFALSLWSHVILLYIIYIVVLFLLYCVQ